MGPVFSRTLELVLASYRRLISSALVSLSSHSSAAGGSSGRSPRAVARSPGPSHFHTHFLACGGLDVRRVRGYIFLANGSPRGVRQDDDLVGLEHGGAELVDVHRVGPVGPHLRDARAALVVKNRGCSPKNVIFSNGPKIISE